MDAARLMMPAVATVEYHNGCLPVAESRVLAGQSSAICSDSPLRAWWRSTSV